MHKLQDVNTGQCTTSDTCCKSTLCMVRSCPAVCLSHQIGRVITPTLILLRRNTATNTGGQCHYVCIHEIRLRMIVQKLLMFMRGQELGNQLYTNITFAHDIQFSLASLTHSLALSHLASPRKSIKFSMKN